MNGLTPAHHAVLFALLARQIIALAGPADGERVIRLGVRRYGEQRGRRMARRALAAGEPLNVQSYFKWSEWQAAPGEVEQSMPVMAPHLHHQVTRCPWDQAWREQDLLAYGQLYCQEIDQALVHGFNPALELEIQSTLAGGGICCEFIFQDDSMDLSSLGIKPAVLPWEYHLGHLFQVLRAVAGEEWGLRGLAAAGAALTEFESRYGSQAKTVVLAHRTTHFDQV